MLKDRRQVRYDLSRVSLMKSVTGCQAVAGVPGFQRFVRCFSVGTVVTVRFLASEELQNCLWMIVSVRATVISYRILFVLVIVSSTVIVKGLCCCLFRCC